ncbi:NADPH-dependent F420 reductase [Actinomadura sp. NTSP31]|uniref:NADPH-dependent F420 reductase n=1 Tax=Actinomadura sp. NTSP31 TaxID=1735447 RepID=UPI0035C099C5
MTTVGFIGSGNIGSTIARLAIEAGYRVVLSNSRGPETLADTVAELGPRASAATTGEAAAAGDIVVVTVPVTAFPDVPAAPLAGKTVIDTCNYGPERDGHIPELDSKSLTSSELLLRYIPDARVVKAFNNIFFKHLLSLTRPEGAADRSYLPIAGDSAPAKGGGDRIHRIHRVQRRGRRVAGRQLAAGDGHAGVGDPIRAALEREGPDGQRGRHPRGTGHRNAVTASCGGRGTCPPQVRRARLPRWEVR